MNSRTCKFSGLDETETLLSSLIENLFLYLLRICFPFAILDTLYYVFTALITHTYLNPAVQSDLFTFLKIVCFPALIPRIDSTHSQTLDHY